MASGSNHTKNERWNPALYAQGHIARGHEKPFVVIILNQPVEDKALLVSVCRRAAATYCADGGANRLYDLGLEGEEQILCRPTAICGDLDSLRIDVLNHYSQQGVRIVKDEDQYRTDLMKCLDTVAKDILTQGQRDPQKLDVAIFGSLGGRADQAFSLLNYLYVCQGGSQHPSQVLPGAIWGLYLITLESIIFCLQPGDNEITTPVGPGALGESVGIIPLGTPSTITTTGLEWDVENWNTSFGGQVSTSNHIKSELVTVNTTAKVLFTVEISKEPRTQEQYDDTP